MAIVSIKDKGTQIMDGMLLSQYTNSTLLRQYMLAYISEMDLLFQNIEEVHFGRMLEHAIGVQLDIIGEILQQTRNVVLPTGELFFGFQGASSVGKMADEATPTDGGVFKDGNASGAEVTPLSDAEYRKLLACKGYILSSPTQDIETIYRAIYTLLGRIPETLTLSSLSARNLELTISGMDTTEREQQIIGYARKYLVPSSTTFVTIIV